MKRREPRLYHGYPVVAPPEPWPDDPEERPWRSVGLGVPVRLTVEACVDGAAPTRVRLMISDPAGVVELDTVWLTAEPSLDSDPELILSWPDGSLSPSEGLDRDGESGATATVFDVPEGTAMLSAFANGTTRTLGPGLLTLTLCDADDPDDGVVESFWLHVLPPRETLRSMGPTPDALSVDAFHSPRHAAVYALIRPAQAVTLVRALAAVFVEEHPGLQVELSWSAESPRGTPAQVAELGSQDQVEEAIEGPPFPPPSPLATLVDSARWREALDCMVPGEVSHFWVYARPAAMEPTQSHSFLTVNFATHHPVSTPALVIMAVHVGERSRLGLMRRLRSVVDAEARTGSVVQALATRTNHRVPFPMLPLEFVDENSIDPLADTAAHKRLCCFGSGTLWLGPDLVARVGREAVEQAGSTEDVGDTVRVTVEDLHQAEDALWPLLKPDEPTPGT